MNNSNPSQAVQAIGQIFNVTLWNEDSTIIVAESTDRPQAKEEAQQELDYNNINATVTSVAFGAPGGAFIRFHIKYK